MKQKIKKISERKYRSLRLRYWKSESKRLRRSHRGILFGAALLILALMISYTFICASVYILLYRHIALSETFTIIYCSVSAFVGFMLYGLLFIGGKRLALSFYGEGKGDGINPLFYAFSGFSGFSRSLKILFTFIFRILGILLLSSLAFIIWRETGRAVVLIAGAIILILLALSVEKHSLEWIFIMKGNKKSDGRGYADRMSKYAMTGRRRESLGAFFSSAVRFLFGAALFGIGLLFIYFPYAWTLDAARSACIAEEIRSGSGSLS